MVKKRVGSKKLILPKFVVYGVALVGVVFLLIFFGYLFSKVKKENKFLPEEIERLEKEIRKAEKEGIILNESKKEEELTLVVSRELWKKLNRDYKESLCFAKSVVSDVKRVQIVDSELKPLAYYEKKSALIEVKD